MTGTPISAFYEPAGVLAAVYLILRGRLGLVLTAGARR